MANNPYVNKVVYGGTTLIDISDTTATADKILEGYTAYGADGQKLTGTASGQSLVVTDTVDEHGGTIRTITGKVVELKTKNITSNGTFSAEDDDADGYTSVTVNVSGDAPTIQSLSVTPSESQQIFNASSVDGYKPVTVGAISTTYVGTGITRRSSTDLTASGATVTVPSGYYSEQASKAVASGTAGTPTATKGTVSNHQVSVTPSVTNTTGYISGGTKTGTAVAVSASELVSGSQTITENGTVDVTNLASVTVACDYVTYYTGSSAPSSSLGADGDIYLKTV